MSTDRYSFWQAKLAGRNDVDPLNPTGTSDGWIGAGFWHTSRFAPVAIWYDEDDKVWVCKRGNEETDDQAKVVQVFEQLMKSGTAITEEDYYAKTDRGVPFQAEVIDRAKQATIKSAADRAEASAREKQRAADVDTRRISAVNAEADRLAAERIARIGEGKIGDNKPPVEPISVREHISALQKELDRIKAEGVVEAKETYELVSLIKSTATSLGTKAAAARALDKAPHIEANKRFDLIWNPIDDEIDALKRACGDAVADYLEAERIRKAEEDRKRREAIAAAKETGQAAPAAPKAEKRSGIRPRNHQVTTIEDLHKVIEFFVTLPLVKTELEEFVTKIAHRMLVSKVTVPGARIDNVTKYS